MSTNHWQICEREWPRRYGFGPMTSWGPWKSCNIILIFFSQTSKFYCNCKSASVSSFLWDASKRRPWKARIGSWAIEWISIATHPSPLCIWIVGFFQIWGSWHICQRGEWACLATKEFWEPGSPAKSAEKKVMRMSIHIKHRRRVHLSNLPRFQVPVLKVARLSQRYWKSWKARKKGPFPS